MKVPPAPPAAADIAFLRAACRAGWLMSWEVAVVLWAVLDRWERAASERKG